MVAAASSYDPSRYSSISTTTTTTTTVARDGGGGGDGASTDLVVDDHCAMVLPSDGGGGGSNLPRDDLASSIPAGGGADDRGDVAFGGHGHATLGWDHHRDATGGTTMRDSLWHPGGGSLASTGGGGGGGGGWWTMQYDGDARRAPPHLSGGGRLDAAADATTLADVSSGFGGGGGGGGAGSLRALASSVPVDPQVSASLTDDALGAADRMGDYLRDIKINNQNRGYYNTNRRDGGWGGGGTGRWGGDDPLAGGGGGGSGLGAADVPDQSRYSFVPDVDDGLADSILSRRLSDLDYDSLQRDGGDALTGGFAAAADSGSSPMPHAGGTLGDSIRDQLDRLNLPHYHIEMPTTMANPFSGAASPPSMEDALSSIKAASGASGERLGSLLDAATRSFEGLSERVADASTSFEGLPSRSSIVPDVDEGPADSILSRQLSGLNYDSLQRDGGAALTEGFVAADPGSSPMPHAGGSLGDSIRDQLDRLNLPRYHFEMPTMGNPFSGASSPPAMEDALSSIEAASGASEERLGSLLDTVARSFEGLSERVADASTSFEGLSGRMAEVGNAGAVGALADALRGGASKVAAFRPPSFDMEASNFDAPKLPQVHVGLPTFPNLSIIDGTSAAVRQIGDASLADFGNAVLSTIKFTGGIVVRFLDFILNAVSETSVASVLSNAQISVTTAMESARHAVVGTLTEIGNMSLIEILQHVMKLVIVITDILLKITNAVLYVISGKDGAAWALQATSSIDGASTQLLARAEDFTHASLAEMTHSIGDYGQLVGGEFVTLIASVSSAVNGMSLAGVSLPDNVLDNVASAVQTAFSL